MKKYHPLKIIFQATLIILLASSLSLIFFKGPYIAEHYILGKLGNIQSQEKMGDIFRRAFFSEKRDFIKANSWYINAVDYWYKNKSDISLADKKTVLRMLAKVAYYHEHDSEISSRTNKEPLREAINVYLTIAEIMPLSDVALRTLWSHRNKGIYPDTLTKIEFENKIYAHPRDKNWFKGYTAFHSSSPVYATTATQNNSISWHDSPPPHKKPYFKIVESCWQTKQFVDTNIVLVCVE